MRVGGGEGLSELTLKRWKKAGWIKKLTGSHILSLGNFLLVTDQTDNLKGLTQIVCTLHHADSSDHTASFGIFYHTALFNSHLHCQFL